MYLFDTNVVSEVRKPRPHGGVVAWLRSVSEKNLFISAVTLGEIQTGIESLRNRDEAKAHEIERWLDRLAESYFIIPMDRFAFRMWARLMHRRSDTMYEDAMIAATAKIHNLVVVTRNVRDFVHFDVSIFYPFGMAKSDKR